MQMPGEMRSSKIKKMTDNTDRFSLQACQQVMYAGAFS